MKLGRAGKQLISAEASQNKPQNLHMNETKIGFCFPVVLQVSIRTLNSDDRSMLPFDFWTTLLIVLNLNARLSLTLNETDARWVSIGAEARFNATPEEKPTENPRIKHELYIGGLFDLNTRYGAGELYAAMMAAEEINQDSRYLPDCQIVLYHQRSTEVRKGFILFFSFVRRTGGS